jgi:hypothetical protein
MTVTATRLSESVQALIDSRLDTIERMLLGRVSRQDRMAIVRDVETQIHELLQEQGDADIGRDEVLAVLARLDPPEAYLPDDAAVTHAAVRLPLRATAGPAPRGDESRVARASGALGIAALLLLLIGGPLFFVVAELSESEILMLGGFAVLAGLVAVAGVLGLALGITARRAGPWGIVGIVASVFSLVFGCVAAAFLVLLL